mmetsp:Transcript_16238/g.27786  ORF Transcript_16238/g.27786 Transcript_16238/m.27786 type:complete len:289 (-) Transcript_16238:22-888(-)
MRHSRRYDIGSVCSSNCNHSDNNKTNNNCNNNNIIVWLDRANTLNFSTLYTTTIRFWCTTTTATTSTTTTTTTPARPQPTPPSSTTSSFQASRVVATPAPAPDTTTAALDADFAALDELENAFADSMAAAESSFQSSTNNTAQAQPKHVTSTSFNTNTTTTTTSHTSNNNNVTDTTQSDLDALDSLLQDSLATGDDINAEVSFNNADDLIALEEPVFEPTPAPKQDLNDVKAGGETFDFDEVFGRLDLKALNELGLDENDAEEPQNTGSSTMDLDFDNLLVQLSKDLY